MLTPPCGTILTTLSSYRQASNPNIQQKINQKTDVSEEVVTAKSKIKMLGDIQLFAGNKNQENNNSTVVFKQI